MPYNGVPQNLTEKMERCVKHVMSQGKAKENAIAICHTSLVGKKAQNSKMRKVACQYRKLCTASSEKAKLSGLGSIPAPQKLFRQGVDSPKKAKLAKAWRKIRGFKFGPSAPAIHTAKFGNIGMTDYAKIKVAFLKEGAFNVNGVKFFHPWNIIERDSKSFEGEEFYLNHIEDGGTEYGKIMKVYPQMVDGEKWLCAEIHIPETAFTQATLERLQTGLSKYVSSTHILYVNPDKDDRTVDKIDGDGISLVKEPEVSGAHVYDVERHLKN